MSNKTAKTASKKATKTPTWAADRVAALHERLAALGSDERAVHERAYLKSTLVHLGVAVPEIRKLARAVDREGPAPTDEQLRTLTAALWSSGIHDLRMLAIALLERWRIRLIADDLAWLERWLAEAGSWAYVDWLAVKVVGPLVERKPERGYKTLDRWAVADNFWLRRSAMLALLEALRDGDGDFERFAGYAEAMLGEQEFFIRKAIGWVLRDLGRKRPELTRAFVEAHLSELSGVSFREAIKVLPPTEQEAMKREWVAAGSGKKGTTKKTLAKKTAAKKTAR